MLTQKPNLGAIGESRVQRVSPEAPAVEGDATSDVPLYTIAEAQKRESACASEAMPDLSGRVQMRMAKASDADLNVAYRLMRLVDAIGDGYHPSDEEGAPTFFDDDDWEHLQFLHRQIAEIAESSGGIHRVVGAAGILLDQKNNLIDPDDNCIELSPDLKAAQKAAELWEYFQGFIRANGAGSITDLVVQRDNLQAANSRLRAASELVLSELESYERHGESCIFEGSPMIYGSTLEALSEAARQALQPEEGNHG